jgi:hypothetical protein
MCGQRWPKVGHRQHRPRAVPVGTWLTPADEEADLAALRAGTPVTYAEVRTMLAGSQ